jgi:asparagine synthase (glutamine-hydrolysing)
LRNAALGSEDAALGYLTKPGRGKSQVCIAAEGQVVLVADARLFNQPEIVALLRRHGREAARDAEPQQLLLELYLACGPRFALHARGMFTAAVWDGRVRRLALTRDAVGERPLYYARTAGHLAFASTLRALRCWSRLDFDVDLDGVRKYLTYGFLPGEVTLLKGVRELLPGHYLTVELDQRGTVTTKCMPYWQPEEAPAEVDSPVEVYSRPLRQLLEDAVQERLPASGPVGVLLSGGLDSSAITALAARLHASYPVRTYSVSFGPEYPSELPFSSMVARHCHTTHHIVEISGEQVARHLPETVSHIDDPIGDPLTVPNFLLDGAASADVDVVLNGEGGDPCFGGPKNLPMLLHAVYGDGAQPSLARERSYLRSYQKCYDDLAQLLTPAVQERLATMPPQEELLSPFLDDRSGMQSYLNKLMLINVRLKGPHHILCKVDRMTAAHGIEGRSPLFDRRIVELSFQVPPRWKLSGSNEKFVLKRAVNDILPAEIIARPKSGMLVPVQCWFRGPLRGPARQALLGRRARRRGILNQALLRDWLDYRGSLLPRYGVKLWLVLTLELWFRTYIDAPRDARFT